MERTWYELVLIPLETAFYSETKKKICYIAHPDSKPKTGKSPGINRESAEENRIKRDSNSIFSLQMDIARLQMEFLSGFGRFFRRLCVYFQPVANFGYGDNPHRTVVCQAAAQADDVVVQALSVA